MYYFSRDVQCLLFYTEIYLNEYWAFYIFIFQYLHFSTYSVYQSLNQSFVSWIKRTQADDESQL